MNISTRIKWFVLLDLHYEMSYLFISLYECVHYHQPRLLLYSSLTHFSLTRFLFGVKHLKSLSFFSSSLVSTSSAITACNTLFGSSLLIQLAQRFRTPNVMGGGAYLEYENVIGLDPRVIGLDERKFCLLPNSKLRPAEPFRQLPACDRPYVLGVSSF